MRRLRERTRRHGSSRLRPAVRRPRFQAASAAVLRLDPHHGDRPGRRADRGRRRASTRTARLGHPAQGCLGHEGPARARLVLASLVLAHLALDQLALAHLYPAQLALAHLSPAQLARAGRDRRSGRYVRADRAETTKAGIGATVPPGTGPAEAGLTRAEPTVAGFSPIESAPIEPAPIEFAPTSPGWSSTARIETRSPPQMTGCPGQDRTTKARPDSTTNRSTPAVQTAAIEPTGSAVPADQSSV